MQFIDYFRLSLKAVVKDQQLTLGKTVKKTLASQVGISMPYLNDIALARKAGSEDVRHRITGALGYKYLDFIEVGKLLHEGHSLAEAKRLAFSRRPAEGYSTDLAEEINLWSSELPKERQNIVLAFFKEQFFQSWEHYNTAQNIKGKPAEIYRFIWQKVCEESGMILPFGPTTFELLQSSNLNAADIYYEAKNYVKKIQNSKK